jgi:DNA mismatch repair protein MutL
VVIVTGGPELFRHDRRRQFIFANGRRINDYSLLQALEYGVQGWFPGNTHPVGAVYIDIDPSLADFNIHPAKREVRFRDPGLVHRTISSALRDFVRRNNYSVYQERKRETGGYLGAEFGGEFRPPEDQHDQPGQAASVQSPAPGGADSLLSEALRERHNIPYYPPVRDRGWATGPASSLAMQALLDSPPCFIPPPRQSGPETEREIPAMYGEDVEIAGGVSERPAAYTRSEAAPRLVGRLFELFILVERGDTFYIIDQHAAHERILYDRFMSGPIPRQELLVPIPFTTDSEIDDRFLKDRQGQLARLGVVLAADGKGNWQIEALPSGWRLSDAETIQEILALRDAGENMAEKWAATLCCHGAVKDGDFLDAEAAVDLAKQALRLPVPRCPHGRPVWKELSRLELYQAVRRI